MKTLNLIQGSKEWHEHRATHFNASDASAMMGLSKYKSRSQLIKERATGIVPEVDDATQRRFNDGHRFEALARPIIEAQIGEQLSPVTLSKGKMSCSCDGLTFDDSIAWEHKQWNALLANAVSLNCLPEDHKPQCQQVLMITGAEKLIFTVSDGTLENMVSMEVLPDTAWFERIHSGWEQFEKDVSAYVPVEVIDAPQADPIQSLPAVVIQVSGELTLCNLDAVTPKFDLFLAKAEEGKANIDIHNGKAIAEFSRAAAVDCKLTAKAVVSQMSSVSEAVSKLELYAKKFDAMGLFYEKEVDRLKEIEKVAALNKAKAEYAAHLAALQAEIDPIRLVVPVVDFALAIKGLKTPESKNNALNTALANGKIEADAIAKDLRAKLAWMRKDPQGIAYLDLQQIIQKPMEDFQLIITTRIKERDEREKKREEELRAKIEAEAQAARIAQDTSLMPTVPTMAEDRAKMAEDRAKMIEQSNKPTSSVSQIKPRPTDREIIGAIRDAFGCTHGQACDYILAVAENLRMAA